MNEDIMRAIGELATQLADVKNRLDKVEFIQGNHTKAFTSQKVRDILRDDKDSA